MSMKKTRTEVTVPHLAETLVSATIGKWLRKPGDVVEQYDVICELITDKVSVEMPSPVGGTIVELLVPDGAEAAVGEAICIIEQDGAGGVTAPMAEAPTDAAVPATADKSRQQAVSVSAEAPARGRYSPAVLQLAAQHHIDLNRIQGTGMGGRITRKDVENAAAAGAGAPQGQTSAAPSVDSDEVLVTPVRSTGLHLSSTPSLPNIEKAGRPVGSNEYLMDVTPIRNTIATRMRQSVSEIPHAWTMIEVDVTNLVALRTKLKDDFRRQEGINLTYLAFVLKAVVGAIKDYPIMNSVWATDKIIVKRDINVALAVGTEDSVMTPVIKNADQKSIAGLAITIDELTRKARNGKLKLDELQGGTFTLNNTGSFGSILSYPIINYPQAAILTFESIVKRPVVIQDMLAVRSMANMCLSLDHRILDGVICGRFLQRVKENLESYSLETTLY